MKGTEKQAKWAEDIKVQVMEAAHEAYEGSTDEKWGTTFEQSKVGHAATFAAEHMDDAKFWIDHVGYAITDYGKRCEAAKSRSDLAAIITGIATGFGEYADQYQAEENDLKTIRIANRKAYTAARK